MIRASRPARRGSAVLLAAVLTAAAAAMSGCSLEPSASAAARPPAAQPAAVVAVDDSATPDPSTATGSSAGLSARTTTEPTSMAPVPATRTSYAKHVPAYPPDGRHGRRIVYSKALMHVWVVSSADRVVRSYAVTGRWDRPAKGVYRVYSKSPESLNAHSRAMFRWMVRFAWGTTDRTAAIGFHSVPVYYADNPARGAKKGDRMSSAADLGLPVATGGCVRQSDADAEFLYRWARVGDTVVVLPTA